MAWIYPNSTIHLLENIPLTNAYIHTVDYSDRSAQLQDFLSYNVLTLDNYTYIRNNTIKVEGQIKNLYAVNYMLFKNTNFENKWFYAFVTSVEYLNNETCIITYEIDIMQTYLFDFMAMPSYVERETVAHDDLFGSLTDEELEVGEYQVKSAYHPDIFDSDSLVPIVGVSRRISDTTDDFIISANKLYGMSTYETYYVFNNHNELARFYDFYRNNGNTEDLLEMFLFPFEFLRNVPLTQDHQGFYYMTSTANGTTVQDIKYSIAKAIKGTTTFDNYIPKNAKMYNSPYMKIVVTDLEGNSVEYSPEYFNTQLNPQAGDSADNIYFTIKMPVNSIPQPQVLPHFYKSRTKFNYSYLFVGSSFGQMPLVTDTYAAWLAMNSSQLQNQYNVMASSKRYIAQSGAQQSAIATNTMLNARATNIGEQMIGDSTIYARGIAGAVGSAGQMLTNPLGGIAGYGASLAQLSADETRRTVELSNLDRSSNTAYRQAQLAGIRERYDNEQAALAIQGLNAKITDAATMSPSVRGMGNNNIAAALYCKGIAFIVYAITDEYAERIDRYLSVYGYKVNIFKDINTKSRRYWNYIKTVNANIVNNGITTKLPHTARIGIKNIFDNGITFWHSGLASVFRYGDYTNPENT